MSFNLFLQPSYNNQYHGFLINAAEVWNCYQRSPLPTEAIIAYYKELMPMTDGVGEVLVLDIRRWKEMSKSLSASLYLNYSPISQILPAIPQQPVYLLNNRASPLSFAVGHDG